MSDSAGSASMPSASAMAKLSEKVKQKLDQGKKVDKKKGKKDTPKDKKKEKKVVQEKEDEWEDEQGGDKVREEFEKLGGSKEDLEMLNGVDSGSDSEMEFDSANVKDEGKLDGDVASYMKDIGFNVSKQDLSKKSAPPLKEKEKEEKKKDKKKEKNEKPASKEKKDKKKEVKQEKKSMPIVEESIDTRSISHSGKLCITPRPDWYNPDLSPAPEPAGPVGQYANQQLLEKAKELLQKENEVYTAEGDSRSISVKRQVSQFLTAGTLSDKISTLTLLIQESPLHSVKYFDQLFALCKKKSKSSAMQGINALADLFVGGVLPDRKLKWFKNQPVSGATSREWLIVWAFEDWMKGFYFNLLQILEALTHDAVPYIRRNTTSQVFGLLRAKPEQEVNLLRLGVNKLGDKDRNVASNVVQMLLRLEEAHPAMKAIVVEAISELIFRPGSDYHARYYGVVTLNQTTLLSKEVEMVNSLMKIYLTLFERLLAEWNQQKPLTKEEQKKVKKPRWKNNKGNKGKKGGERQEAKNEATVKEEEDGKMTNAILTGLVRAFPFSDLPKETFDQHMNALYRVTHSANFATSLQALKLIHQVSRDQTILSDRFYRTLYESLLDPRLAVSNKHLKDYMNLLFRSLKEDGNQERLKAFAKRIVQMATSWLNIGVISAVVFMLQELAKSSEHLRDLFTNQIKKEEGVEGYDGRKRDPVYANAGSAKLWELIPLLAHFHPTVTVYAQGFLENDVTMTRPDLELHTLNHFLDRFVYKNPRSKQVTRGGAIMQPLAGADKSHTAPVTEVNWSHKNLADVDASERFFYQYFANRDKPAKKSKKDEEELDEDEVFNALVNSSSKGGDGDEDVEFDNEDFSDMEDLDAMSDDEDLEDIEQEDDDQEELEGEEDEEAMDFEDEEADEIASDDEIEVGDKRKLLAGDNEDNEDNDNDSKSKRRRIKDLPAFASADDYAHLLGSDDDDY